MTGPVSTTMLFDMMSYAARLCWKKNTVRQTGKKKASEKFLINDLTKAL